MPPRQRRLKTKTHTEPILVDGSEERRIADFRPLGFRDVQVLGRYRYGEAHPALPLHSHGKMIEICYLESGRQTYRVGSQRFDLNGGDVFVTFPNELHGSAESPEGKGVLYWMLIRIPAGRQRFLSLNRTDASLVLNRLLNLAVRHFFIGQEIGYILRQAMEVFDRGEDSLRCVRLQSVLLRFVLEVLDASCGMRRRVSPEIQAVQTLITENLTQALPVSRLARSAHMSESRFKARFKAEVGAPPADYAMRQRIDRSIELLRHTELPVTRIALSLGFSSTQYFATVFRRYTGIAPSECRQQRDNH
jgi:AraC-like DNA-binding protein/quercetin dioxygenase-like cupin family protein